MPKRVAGMTQKQEGQQEKVTKMIDFIKGIPDVGQDPLTYCLEQLSTHQDNTLWLEFGVYTGTTINKIATYTTKTVYGFDSFEGLPEDWRPKYDKGAFSLEGRMPETRPNVQLIKGWFQDTLKPFLQQQDRRISFLHIDSDLYSSAKYILDTCKAYLAEDCLIVFDELVNFEYFESDKCELMALYDFLHKNPVEWEWVGMQGPLNLTLTKGIKGYYYPYHQNAAIRIKNTQSS